MGTWGLGPFENDGALEPLSDLEHGEADVLGTCFATVHDHPDYLEVTEGQPAIAAAEIVAAAFGKPVDGLPDRVVNVVALKREQIRKLPDIVRQARDAVRRVVSERSELAELWDEGRDGAAWRASIAGLDARLSELRDE